MPSALNRTTATGRTSATGRATRTTGTTTQPDVVPPVVSGIGAGDIGSTVATVSFATNEAATSIIQYGTAADFTGATTAPVETTPQTSHQILLTGLTPDTTYYYRARATDLAANVSDWSASNTFVLTGGGAGWVDAGAVANVTLGALNLEATYKSILVELPFTETVPNTLTSATVEYRTSPGGTVRTARAMTVARPVNGRNGDQPACYSKIRLRAHNTAYDVRVTLNGTATKAGSVTTKNDNATAPASLVPTLWVDPINGLDTNLGRAATQGSGTVGPVKTFSRAHTLATAGVDVIEVNKGWMQRWAGPFSKALTWKAKYPACDDNGALINAGNRTSIFQVQAGPTGATDPHLASGNHVAKGPWTLYDAGNNIWIWAVGASGTARAGVSQAAIHPTLDGAMTRLAHWSNATGDADTVAKWVTLVTTNLDYNYGFYRDASYNLYVRIPPKYYAGDAALADPNNSYLTFGGTSNPVTGGAFYNTATGSRFCGFMGKGLDALVSMTSTASFAHIDHWATECCYYGVRIGATTGSGATASTYGSDHLIEAFNAKDEGMFTYPGPTAENTISWALIKSTIRKASGSQTSPQKLAGNLEGAAVNITGGAKRMTIRRGVIDGTFNGISGGSTTFDRYQNYGLDLHDLDISHCADECIELETSQVNVAWWNIYGHDSKHSFSSGPLNIGPEYGFNSRFWRCGAHGHAPWPPASTGTQPGAGGFHKIQNSSSASVRPNIYIENVTYWTNAVTAMNIGAQGSALSSGSANMPHIYHDNVLIRSTARPVGVESEYYTFHPRCSLYALGDEHAGLVRVDTGATNAADYFLYGGVQGKTKANVATIRALLASYLGAEPDGFQYLGVEGTDDIAFNDEATIDALFTDAANGDLTLAGGSDAIGAGMVLPEIHDGLTFEGTTPNIGWDDGRL